MDHWPHAQLMYIALLDFVQFAMLFISAHRVAPPTLAIIMYASPAMSILAARYRFPHREYSPSHVRGGLICIVAVLVTFVEPVVFMVSQESFSSLLAHMLCISSVYVQSISNSQKEFSLVAWAQPVDFHYISCWLFFYQLIFGILLSPAIFYAQGAKTLLKILDTINLTICRNFERFPV